MKTSLLTIGCLALICFGLMVCRPTKAQNEQPRQSKAVNKQPGQIKAWEYATVEKTEGVGCYLIINGFIVAKGDQSFFQLAADMNSRLKIDLKLKANGSDARGLIMVHLGLEGWELVSSSYKLRSSNGGMFRSNEVLHFKRPRIGG